jgi:hypothetical protein
LAIHRGFDARNPQECSAAGLHATMDPAARACNLVTAAAKGVIAAPLPNLLDGDGELGAIQRAHRPGCGAALSQ